LQHGYACDRGLTEQPAAEDGTEVAAVGVASPADPLLQEPARGVGHHRPRHRVHLIGRAIPGVQHEPGQPAIVARHARAPPERLSQQAGQHLHQDIAPVGDGSSRQAGDPTAARHRRDVGQVLRIEHPIGGPAAHRAAGIQNTLARTHAAHGRIGERPQEISQQRRLPQRVRVAEDDDRLRRRSIPSVRLLRLAGLLVVSTRMRGSAAAVPARLRSNSGSSSGTTSTISAAPATSHDSMARWRICGSSRNAGATTLAASQ